MTTPNATEQAIAREISPVDGEICFNGIYFNGKQFREQIEKTLADRREACARKAEEEPFNAAAAIRSMED